VENFRDQHYGDACDQLTVAAQREIGEDAHATGPPY
jgi:hypothetical protein